MEHSRRYGEYIQQMDGLVVFMAMRGGQFHRLLTDHWSGLFEHADGLDVPIQPDAYEQLILRSTVLLAATYSESYLADMLRTVLLCDIRILKTIRGNSELLWNDVIDAGNYEALANSLVDKELSRFTRQSAVEMFRYFEKHLKCPLSGEDLCVAEEGWMIRNLITHNGAVVDSALHRVNPRFAVGERIVLTSDIHRYGMS